MNKIEFVGKISTSSEWDELMIGNDVITDVAEPDFYDTFVRLFYYISNEPIVTNSIAETMLTNYYSGICSIDNEYLVGTSWTGVYGKNDCLQIGERDIIQELSNYIGKYCYLTIEHN